jgi:gliding motility-associated-like protein
VGAGTYYVQAVNGTCSASSSLTVTIKELPLKPLTSQDTIYCRGSELATMTVSGGTGIFIWYSDANLLNEIGTGNSLMPEFILGTSVYYITENENGCEGPVSAIQITIIDCEIVIPSAFTPNGDMVNDFWEIVDMDEVYPSNVVYVYNRWGNLVYKSNKGSYASKPWDGTYNGDKLPVASYYYMIDLSDADDELLKGTVAIITK